MDNIVHAASPMDHAALTAAVELLAARYPFLEAGVLGRTMFGRDIPVLTLGRGGREVLYVGAHHGSEWITALLCMRFVEDFCEHFISPGSILGYDLSYILKRRSIHIVPMLNPDGVQLSLHGADEQNPFYDRLIRQNGGSNDFSRWQANGRGVDLNHNYDAGWGTSKLMEREHGIFGGGPTRYGGEYPESERETEALCRFVRGRDIELALAFHSQGEVIYWEYGDKTPRASQHILGLFCRATGYAADKTDGIASYAGFKDWFIERYGRPGFTVEVGRGQNPLPIGDFAGIYERCRELMLMAPMVI